MAYSVDEERDFVDEAISLWTEEVPYLDTSGKQITGRILRLAEAVNDRMNGVLHGHGIKYGTYAILATLRASGAPYAMTPKSLQATLVVTSGGLSNQIARLEAKGLVTREVDPSDGRGVLVKLTPEGCALADRTMPPQAQAERDFVRMLSPEERQQLENLLRRVLLLNAHS
ncbi:MarR family transcriptional regulator [Thioclava sp. GXIMD2076]|uniref:MarR family transcriptional regulator n=1 Tax=Thioclava kandeliae TaxID=3070818 RepID=A0ABV1SKD8_9RHOB